MTSLSENQRLKGIHNVLKFSINKPVDNHFGTTGQPKRGEAANKENQRPDLSNKTNPSKNSHNISALATSHKPTTIAAKLSDSVSAAAQRQLDPISKQQIELLRVDLDNYEAELNNLSKRIEALESDYKTSCNTLIEKTPPMILDHRNQKAFYNKLFQAFQTNDIQTARLMIETNLEKIKLEQKNSSGETLYQLRKNNHELRQVMIKHPDAKQILLIEMIKNHNATAVKRFLGNMETLDIHWCDSEGKNALDHAISLGDRQIMTMIADHMKQSPRKSGQIVKKQTDPMILTSANYHEFYERLFAAFERSDTATVQLMMQKNRDAINLEAQNASGQILHNMHRNHPELRAITFSHPDAKQLFVNRLIMEHENDTLKRWLKNVTSLNIHWRDNQGRTALDHATLAQNNQAIEIINLHIQESKKHGKTADPKTAQATQTAPLSHDQQSQKASMQSTMGRPSSLPCHTQAIQNNQHQPSMVRCY